MFVPTAEQKRQRELFIVMAQGLYKEGFVMSEVARALGVTPRKAKDFVFPQRYVNGLKVRSRSPRAEVFGY